MTIASILALACALAMDTFAVAIGTACALPRVTAGHYFRMAGAFGFSQFAMPVVGWALGLSVRTLIEAWDHWVAFLLLAWVGGSMIREAFAFDKKSDKKMDPSRGGTLFLLAIATSIDALAVGLSFSVLHISPWGPSIIIGGVCSVITGLGLFLGYRLTSALSLGRGAMLGGGLTLIGIGIKILFEHNAFR